jgi:hypothetical protein
MNEITFVSELSAETAVRAERMAAPLESKADASRSAKPILLAGMSFDATCV